MSDAVWTDTEKRMLTLSFVASMGCGHHHTDAIRDAIVAGLERFAPDQELAWGPATHRPALGSVTDACMLLVRERGSGAPTLVIRGTPPPSISSWLLQVFDFVPRIEWRKVSASTRAPEGTLISEGTRRTMHLLTGVALDHPSDASDTRGVAELVSALADELGPDGVLRMAGHSLGGVSVSTLALWLCEELPRVPALDIYSFAGPTAGNSVFASLSDAVIAQAPHRLQSYRNPLDFACSSWNADAMKRTTDAYLEAGKTHMPRWCEQATLETIARLDYTRLAGHVEVPSSFCALPTMPLQGAWQHICAYPYAFLDQATATALLEALLGHMADAGELDADDEATVRTLIGHLRR